jgi:hypothetical protein
MIAHYTQHRSLEQTVPVAAPGADGRHCSKSPEAIHDPIAGPDGKVEDIVGIAKVLQDHQVVGFIYRAASGRYYVQALNSMSVKDQRRAGIVVGKGFAYSSLKRITALPWDDVTTLPCR